MTTAAASSHGQISVLEPDGAGAADVDPGDRVAVADGDELVGDGVVSVGVGVGVGVGVVSVGVGVGVSDFVGVGVGVSVVVGVSVGVAVAVSEAVRVGVVVSLGVGVGVCVGLTDGSVRVGVGRLGVRVPLAVGSVTLPEPHALSASAAPATSRAAVVRRAMSRPPPARRSRAFTSG
ncbi:MAG: hypothetical protein U0R68_15500 [Candidatus Nanopelagicales bacterium]